MPLLLVKSPGYPFSQAPFCGPTIPCLCIAHFSWDIWGKG
jgi:hypothetical protein